MSWPRDHEGKVSCIGFSEDLLPIIKHAVENKIVTWGTSSLFMYSGMAEFFWADCTWKLEEEQECVISIELLQGNPTMEDLTVAMLKGKIESS